MRTHDTFLIGMDKKDQVIFLKSYEYFRQKDEALGDLAWVKDNCVSFHFGAVKCYQINHMEHGEVSETLDIIIPTPTPKR